MSDFGEGLTYCIALFLAHTERIRRDLETYESIGAGHAYEMWFYGASDHMFDMHPEQAPNKSLQRRCAKFKSRCMYLRMPMRDEERATEKDYDWAIEEAKDLLRLIDKANGVKTSKAKWS